MGRKVSDDLLATAKAIAGPEHSEMDIIRALHISKNDLNAAINILFDTPKKSQLPSSDVKAKPLVTVTTLPSTFMPLKGAGDNELEVGGPPEELDWWFLGRREVAGLSTCRGRGVKAGEKVSFSFSVQEKGVCSPLSGKGLLKARQVAAARCSEIVRFATESSGEIGRIPNEWARCLLPLVRDKKVRVEGCSSCSLDMIGIMDTIHLEISVYINISALRKQQKDQIKLGSDSSESIVHPLPNLFRLLDMTPEKKAELTPADFCTRKRPLNASGLSTSAAITPLTHTKKSIFQSRTCNDDEIEPLSDADLKTIVGDGENIELEETEPSAVLLCELRSYQKQALFWMLNLEKRQCLNEDSTTLHPCWNAYRLPDKRGLLIYLNAFSGDAAIEFPSTLQIARGGILADAMGLGKTIMTIALMLARSVNDTLQSNLSTSPSELGPVGSVSKSLPSDVNVQSHEDLTNQKSVLVNGGNLVICPMTLLSQWKAEIDTHVQPGAVSVHVHYGQSRAKDAIHLAQYDIVISTYGVLASEFSAENSEENGGLFSVRWFRIILDEAHTIKNPKSQISTAAAALVSDLRWCLTGTPIQNNLEDIYSLLRFLKVEPWQSWTWWNKLIQKPFEEGDERGLKLIQSILKPIMLRRTKSTTDKEGRPIVVLPPADVQVVYCELTQTERDFYDALFKRSKVKFDQFVEQGRVLHNYASILELLLRLRQCCDHPFLVMSRGDTQEYADLDKLAKRFLKLEQTAEDGHPSRAFIQEVVEGLRKGELGECPICLEAFEDAVLTPCVHQVCRECLLSSWRNHISGLCPVCRKFINKSELVTAPTDSRFRIDIEKNWVESSKITILLRELGSLRLSGSKSIVFSQWTAFLDLLQIPLRRSDISFLRLDGTLNQHQRERVIKQFSEDETVLVLLMSLKAGGVGLNLTAASNAFVMDPWWNPAVEEQAVMRIHRIGQTKRVAIKRIIVKGTVEERMEAVQARKQRLISGALSDQEVRSARIEELKMLFTR